MDSKEERVMSKKQRSKPAVAVLADPIANYVREVKQELSDALLASIPIPDEIHSEPSGNCIPSTIGLTYNPWTDEVSRVVVTDESGKVVKDYKPIQPQEPTQTYREFAEAVVEKMAESLGVPSPLLNYESPSFSSAKIDMQPKPDPVPREDEARPCSLCESRRPAGKSYSRVYCTKAQVRYCKCGWCGYTWSQERK